MEYVQSRWQMFVKWYRQWVAHRRLMVPMVIAGGLLLSACASDEEVYVERPVDELYNSAMDLLLDGSFTAAAEEFDEVERARREAGGDHHLREEETRQRRHH